MNKPLTVARAEMIQDMVKIVNDYSTEIPAFIIEDVLKDLIQTVHSMSEQQYQADKRKYESEEADNNGRELG